MTQITNQDLLERIVKSEQLISELAAKQEDTARKLDDLIESTTSLVAAFNAAQGAFQVLEWLAKVAKPMIFIIGVIGTAYMWFKGLKG